ncbi:OmpA family protein [Streptomyces sp. TP-A0874]|uniref:OmpA family protein n=1 Tax=Streptomyces sp. TP-A0874 TaxID=549819 RepID=UPI000852FCB0|nr:OmpA family protein [Streptomyces sp. TP-A0874]
MKTVRKQGTVLLVSAALVSGVTFVAAPSAFADDLSPAPSVFEGKIDAGDPDLKLPEGGSLAEPKVLEIKQVVGDESGDERRNDSNSEVKFQLQAEVLFGKDSSKLSGAADSRIKEIAEEIKKQDAQKVRVFGFTDNLGSSAHGDVLSKERAQAVHKKLVKHLSSDINFEIRGYGEQYPVADNDTEEGRKLNRRVEVSFERNDSGPQA